MRTGILRRFLWSALILATVSLVGIDLYIAQVTVRDQIEDLRADLTVQARLLVAELPLSGKSFNSWANTAAVQTSARITLLNRESAVLADSEPGAAIGDEVLAVSAAVPDAASPAYELKLSKSLDPIYARMNALLFQLLRVSFFSVALAAGLAYIFVQSLSRQISSLRDYTERLLDPHISEHELPSGDDDLGALAQSLRRTVPRIRGLLDTLKLEGERREPSWPAWWRVSWLWTKTCG